MFQHTKLNNELTLVQKIKSLDYFLLFFIILLGVISIFTMYSTDGGEILFHTKSHFIKFIVFFSNDAIFVIVYNQILAQIIIYCLFNYFRFINLGFSFWGRSLRIKKMD